MRQDDWAEFISASPGTSAGRELRLYAVYGSDDGLNQGQVRELLALSAEGMDYIAGMAERGALDDASVEILKQLREIAVHIETETREAEGIHRQICLYARNIQASIDDLSAQPELYERIIRMEIRPFVLEMKRLWELCTEVLPSEEKRALYRADVMERVKALHDAPPKVWRYDVSIVLLAYNKLEYTMRALESILAYTDFSKGNIELILLNNGSDDGTRAYFESIPHAKVMNLRHNILGTYAYTHILEGKYFVGFSNDVVATPHWLEHLLACMESDARIGTAVPTCNEGSISNGQGIPVPYTNTFEGMAEMQRFAAAHNQLNPALWEEHSQLMPFLHIVRCDLVRFCAADPVFTRAEFVDDDLSTLLRRSGWRQILLKDTFLHHFGSVTLGEGRRKAAGNALDEMRRVYYEKWGVDAWDARGSFVVVEAVWSWHDLRADERVLMLEPRFGDFACDFVNAYRRSGFVPHMTAAVFDAQYLPDTSYLFNETMSVNGIEDLVGKNMGQYDIISAGCYLDELPLKDVIADLERLYALLAPSGMLLLPVRNAGSAYELDYILHKGLRDVYVLENEVRGYVSIPYRQLLNALHTHAFLHQLKTYSVIFRSDLPLMERMKPLLCSDEHLPIDVEESLSVRMFFLGIFRV